MNPQRGMALVEAVVAAALLGGGLLGAMRLVAHALDAARQNRDQEQARLLASEALDCALAARTPCPPNAAVTRQGIRFSVQVQRVPQGPHLTDITVQLDWTAGAGEDTAKRHQRWQTRVSDLPDWVGVSSP